MNRRYPMLMILAAWSTLSQAGTVQLTPSASNLNVGDVITLTISGVNFAEAVGGGGLNLSFDPGKFQWGTTAIDSQWEFLPMTGVVDAAAGTVSDLAFTTFARTDITGNFTIATLTFTALQAGVADFSLSPNSTFVFADPVGKPIAPSSFGSAQVTVADASPVPLPGAALFMLSGLAGVSGFKRAAGRKRC